MALSERREDDERERETSAAEEARSAEVGLFGSAGIISRALGVRAERSIGGYALERELGVGAMGTVYLARDHDGREVALKVLHPHLGKEDRTRKRFEGEAQKLARLRHPGIVELLAFGEDAGRLFFAMEYVAGHDLGEELRRLRGDEDAHGAPLLPARVEPGYFGAIATLTAGVARALHHAHAAGLVHRDVKPQNVLLSEDGAVKLTDLGVARDATVGTMTQTGDLLGTPYYMSPEQARRGRTDDPRSDVYSLGVVLYELLTLRRPFEGATSQQVLHSIAIGDAPVPRAVDARIPRDLESICCKAMAHAPSRRYATAEDFALDLERFVAHEGVAAQPIGARERIERFARRRRKPLVAGALLVLGAGIGLVAVRAAGGPSRRAALLEKLEARVASETLSSEELERDRELKAEVDGAVLDGELRPSDAAVAGFLAAYERELEARESEAQRSFALARAAREDDLAVAHTSWDPDLARALDARERLRRYAGSVPHDLDATSLYPPQVGVRMRVESGRAATIVAVPLDARTGRASEPKVPATRVDTDGAVAWSVPEGPVRFVIGEGDAFVEIERWPRAGRPVEFNAWIRPREDVLQGMLLVEGGTSSYSVRTDPDESGKPQVVELAFEISPFWIDAAPVSNRDYERFLRAQGKPLPSWWPKEPDESWGCKPLAHVSFLDARDYAEWCGKRLPTKAEWLFAFRGPAKLAFPARVSPDDVLRTAGEFSAAVARLDPAAPRATVRLPLYPCIDALPRRSATNGLRDTFGLLSEWCSTWPLDRTEGRWKTTDEAREWMGIAWDRGSDRIVSGLRIGVNGKTDSRQDSVGFRCVRSADMPR